VRLRVDGKQVSYWLKRGQEASDEFGAVLESLCGKS